MHPHKLILCAVLALLTASCATTPSGQPSGLAQIQAQLACPSPPTRLTEKLAPPVFAPNDTWVTWADKLFVWGADEAIRRQKLADWYSTKCKSAP